MILRAAPQGEYGRRLSVLTDRYGKVCVFAQSAAKPGSHLVGVTRPMVCGTFRLARGRNAYNRHGVALMEDCSRILTDFEASCLGAYFLELVDYFSQEGTEPQEARQLLNLSYLALSALQEGRFAAEYGKEVSERLLRSIFELRILVTEGEYTERPQRGGGEELLRLWRHVTGERLSRLFSREAYQGIPAEVLQDFFLETESAVRRFAPGKFHALEVLRERA